MTVTMAPKTDLTGAQYSTYRIGGPLDEAYLPESKAEALALLQFLYQQGIRPTVLGWGSNLIIASRGIRGASLITRKMTWIESVDDTTLRFGAGVFMVKAAKEAEAYSLSGGEYLIGIPGTIGGGVRMNAGALGQETSDLVKTATVFHFDTGKTEVLSHADLQYQYRHSAINSKNQLVIEADLQFKPAPQADVTALMKHSLDFRKTHHPIEPNGGSVFKNPYPKGHENAHMSVGWMLDQLGAKGNWQEGGVHVSERHANFIVNTDNGTSTDLLRLMVRMKRAIAETYGVAVFPENFFIGDATEEETQLWQELTGGAGVGAHE